MLFDIEAFGLSKYPPLEAFLNAPPQSSTFEEARVALISSEGHKKYYPYSLALHVNRNKITVYEICAALDKWEHLKVLLDNEDACEMYLDREAKEAGLQHRRKHLVHELINHAIVNRRLGILERLFAYIDPRGNGECFTRGDLNYLARLAVSTGHILIFNRVFKYVDSEFDVAFADNFLFDLAVSMGYREIAIRLFEYSEVRKACTNEYKKRLIKRGKFAMLDIVLTLYKDNAILAQNDNELLRTAIENGHLPIVKRLLTIREIKKASLASSLHIAVIQRQATILNYLLDCLSRKQWSIIPYLIKTAADIHADDIFILLVCFALTQNIGIRNKGLLMYALREHCVPMFKKLLMFYSIKSVLLRDNSHWKMLCLAADEDVPDIMNSLLNMPNKWAKLCQQNNYLLIKAVETGRLDTVKRLLQVNEIKNASIYGAMLVAVRNDRLDIFNCFCDLHPGAQWQNLYPLFEAAVEFGRKSILKKLLEMADARERRQYHNFLFQPALRKGCHPQAVLCPSSHQFFRSAGVEPDSDEPLELPDSDELTDAILERAGWVVL